MFVCVEYLTHMKRTHTTGELHFFFRVLSFSLPPTIRLFLLPAFKYPVTIPIDNYLRQTPCEQIGQAGAVLQQRRCLCGHIQVSCSRSAM